MTIVKTSTPPTTNREGPLVDEEIRAPQVRLVGAEGEMLGIVATREALKMAHAVGLSLLEVSPNADPPVAKILDYGKFKYEQQKKKNEARKKQKVIEIKELKVRPNIDQNDYEVKLNAAKRFIGGGDKVKLTLRFRGREMAHQELGAQLLERFRLDLEADTKIEQMPKLENRQMIMVLAPR